MNLTDKFFQIILRIRRQSYTPEVDSRVRKYLADTIGVMYAGATDLYEKEESFLTIVGSQGSSRPIGHSRQTSLSDAIFINGLSAHHLELDDGVRYGVIHPSAPLFSALIPVAQANNVKWADFLRGAVCGYETSIRIASSIQPYHYNAGHHPTATCCTLGVAVAVSVMLGWSDEIVKNAFSAACLSACGSLKVLEDVSQLKPYNCAKAALNGFVSAMVAKSGFSGPSDPLGGETGYLRMMAPVFSEEILTKENDFLYLEKIYQKPYASCRHTHPEIEACLSIRKKGDFAFEQIESISVRTYKGVIGKHDFKEIQGEASARMSIPFSMAVALLTGKAGISEFAEPYVSDPRLLTLVQKVNIIADEEISNAVPDKRGAIIDIRMKAGRVLSSKVEYPKGEPENPLSDEDIYEKFSSMAIHAGLSEPKYSAIFEEMTKAKNPDFSILW